MAPNGDVSPLVITEVAPEHVVIAFEAIPARELGVQEWICVVA